MSGEGNSKMTEERTAAALKALENGCTREAAAGTAGVSRVTFWRWMQDETFRNEVEKAEDRAEASFTARIVAEAVKSDGSWQAAAWWLERRRSPHYGRRVELNMNVRAEVERVASARGLDADKLVAEAERILAGMG